MFAPKETNEKKRASESNQIIATVVASVLEISVLCVSSYFLYNWMMKMQKKQMGGRNVDETAARARLTKMLTERAKEQYRNEDYNEEQIQQLVERQIVRSLELNEYETAISEDVIDPADISTTFRDVGGIDHVKVEIFDLVVLPLIRPDLFRSESGLVTPPRGILLYGAPGTGKTMLAKAIAKESGATFVNVRLSSIMDKWFGESNKLISATFSLATKLAPSVIFIDEIDTFLSQRDSGEGSATTSMKSEFLTLWDGMTTDAATSSAPITVLGATNRPYDVDSAILRRLPRTFEIGLPNLQSRIQILNLFLEKQPLTKKARDLIPAVAKSTEGYSGSDLKELCRAAAMEPIREMTRECSRNAVMGLDKKLENNDGSNPKLASQADTELTVEQRNKMNRIQKRTSRGTHGTFGPKIGIKVRPLDEKDFASALQKVKKTGESARSFLRKESGIDATNSIRNQSQDQLKIDANELLKGVQLLQMMMNTKTNQSPYEDNTVESNQDNQDDVPELN